MLRECKFTAGYAPARGERPRLLLLSISSGFGGGIERVARAVEDEWPGPVERVDLYSKEKTPVPAGHPWIKVGFALRAAVAAWRTRPDTVLSLHLGVLPVATVLALTLRAPLTLMGFGREVWTHIPSWERFLVRRCSKLLAISSFTAEYFARRARVNSEAVSVIPLPVGRRFEEALTSEQPTAGDGSSFELLSVSRVVHECRYKGLFSVADGMSELLSRRSDARWVVVGGGDDLPRLRTRCGELGIADHVDFLEDVDDEALLRAYRDADVFVLPSVADPDAVPPTGEGFGLVYAEAACFGLPSIASAAGGGALDFVEDGVSGLTVPVDSPEALAEAVDRLAKAPNLRKRLGAEAQRRVRDRHLPEVFARVLRESLTGLDGTRTDHRT